MRLSVNFAENPVGGYCWRQSLVLGSSMVSANAAIQDFCTQLIAKNIVCSNLGMRPQTSVINITNVAFYAILN